MRYPGTHFRILFGDFELGERRNESYANHVVSKEPNLWLIMSPACHHVEKGNRLIIL